MSSTTTLATSINNYNESMYVNFTADTPDKYFPRYGTAYLFLRNLFSIFGLCMNVGTIFVVLKNKRLHTPSNVLVISLAVADITTSLVGPLTITVTILKLQANLKHWKIFCYITSVFTLNGSFGNFIIICATAYDRFIAIRFPYFYKMHVNLKLMIKISILLWIMVILNSVIFIENAFHFTATEICLETIMVEPGMFMILEYSSFFLVSANTTVLYYYIWKKISSHKIEPVIQTTDNSASCTLGKQLNYFQGS